MGRPRKHKKPISLAFVPGHLEHVVERRANPFHSAAHQTSKSNPEEIDVLVNIRESAIATLAHKGLIDKAQVAAADRFRRLFEAAGGSGAAAMDMTKDVVDGGLGAQDIKDSVVNAMFELVEARKLLGWHGYELVRTVAGERRSIHEICQTRRERDTALDVLRIHLTALAVMWKFAGKDRKAPKVA